MSLIVAAMLLTSDQAKQLVERFSDEPSVDQLCAAAEKEAHVHPERARSWMRRVRVAPWLPQVSVRWDRGIQYDESYDDGPSGSSSSVDTDDDTGWRTQVSWDLSRIVFEPNELGVSREGSNLVELRGQILREIVRLYFERRRLQIDALLAPESPDDRALVRELRIREIESMLDVMTGGLMTRSLIKVRPRRPARGSWTPPAIPPPAPPPPATP
jgi:hypothetical protein